jgi:cell division protein FtsB
MRELESKQRLRKVLYSTPALILFLIILTLLFNGTLDIFKKERQSAQILNSLVEEYDTLSERKIEIEEDIARLDTDEGIREEIRAKFSVSAEDEQTVTILNPKDTEEMSATTSLRWYRRLWNVIMRSNEES